MSRQEPRENHPLYGEQKQKPEEPYIYQQRDAGIVVFISIQAVAAGIGLLAMCDTLARLGAIAETYSRYGISMGNSYITVYGSIVALILMLVCCYGLWKWQNWAYKGFIVLYIASAFLAMFGGNFFQLVINIGAIFLLEAVLKDKKDWLV